MLFATHYHPLCAETAGNARIRQGHMAALVGPQHAAVGGGSSGSGHGGGGGTSGSDGIIFLYKLQDGPCDKSYGLSVRSRVSSRSGLRSHGRHIRFSGMCVSCLQARQAVCPLSSLEGWAYLKFN